MTTTRWNDDRLDDLAKDVEILAQAMAELPALRVQVQSAAQGSEKCNSGLEALRVELREEAAQKSRERKSDLRWIVGTVISSGGLIIAALAVIL